MECAAIQFCCSHRILRSLYIFCVDSDAEHGEYGISTPLRQWVLLLESCTVPLQRQRSSHFCAGSRSAGASTKYRGKVTGVIMCCTNAVPKRRAGLVPCPEVGPGDPTSGTSIQHWYGTVGILLPYRYGIGHTLCHTGMALGILCAVLVWH